MTAVEVAPGVFVAQGPDGPIAYGPKLEEALACYADTLTLNAWAAQAREHDPKGMPLDPRAVWWEVGEVVSDLAIGTPEGVAVNPPRNASEVCRYWECSGWSERDEQGRLCDPAFSFSADSPVNAMRAAADAIRNGRL